MAMGRGPQVSWPRERQGLVEPGKPAYSAGGDCLGQTGGRKPTGLWLGTQLHQPRRAGLGTGPPRPKLQRRAQSSKEKKPSCSLPSQLGLHWGSGGLVYGVTSQ